MPVFYFDNFRGFETTFLSLKNINFFVGENSTGKTSVLKLLRLISNPKFWFTLDFTTEENELGYFSEIASYGASDKSYFEFGVLGENVDKDERISAIKLKFVEKEGLPMVKEINFIDAGMNIEAIIEDDSFSYRYDTVDLDDINEKNAQRHFKIWVKNNGLKNKPFTKENRRDGYGPIFFELQMSLYEVVKKKKRNFGLKLPSFLSEIAWLAPIRTEPKRTYDSYKTAFSPDGTHAPYVLKSMLTNQKTSQKFHRIIQKFGEDSGLFNEVQIKQLGVLSTDPFEIHIAFNNNLQKITNVGYGVSQVLPLIVEVISRPDGTWFAIQQPEIHLHPKGQAAFGDFILKSFLAEKKCFVIETHSDYTIDRFRLKLNALWSVDKQHQVESQVVFFRRRQGGNVLDCIDIRENGAYEEEQPKEFREFFIKEQLALLKI